jgi:hypothetical protein
LAKSAHDCPVISTGWKYAGNTALAIAVVAMVNHGKDWVDAPDLARDATATALGIGAAVGAALVGGIQLVSYLTGADDDLWFDDTPAWLKILGPPAIGAVAGALFVSMALPVWEADVVQVSLVLASGLVAWLARGRRSQEPAPAPDRPEAVPIREPGLVSGLVAELPLWLRRSVRCLFWMGWVYVGTNEGAVDGPVMVQAAEVVSTYAIGLGIGVIACVVAVAVVAQSRRSRRGVLRAWQVRLTISLGGLGAGVVLAGFHAASYGVLPGHVAGTASAVCVLAAIVVGAVTGPFSRYADPALPTATPVRAESVPSGRS